MYELCFGIDTPTVLNLTRVSYSRRIHTQQCVHGGSVWQEPIGSSWSNLELEGICDDKSAVFFNSLFSTAPPVNSFSSFYLKEEIDKFFIKVTGANIIDWRYTDSENRADEVFSLTLSVTDIQRIQFHKIDELKKEKLKRKPKQKKVIIPERQIVICRTI